MAISARRVRQTTSCSYLCKSQRTTTRRTRKRTRARSNSTDDRLQEQEEKSVQPPDYLLLARGRCPTNKAWRGCLSTVLGDALTAVRRHTRRRGCPHRNEEEDPAEISRWRWPHTHLECEGSIHLEDKMDPPRKTLGEGSPHLIANHAQGTAMAEHKR